MPKNPAVKPSLSEAKQLPFCASKTTIRWGIILAAIVAVISGVLFFLQANADSGMTNLSEINLEHYAE